MQDGEVLEAKQLEMARVYYSGGECGSGLPEFGL